jgi:Na+-transporting NADH:ubiquinone oxidoreductase subunit D
VIIVDIAMRAYYPEVHKLIGPYVGLIITNCIIMGRCEAFATKNTPLASFWDGLGAGIGYSIVLIMIAVVRETLGFGTLYGFALPARDVWLTHPWTIMVMPPGAFFMLALVAWLGNATTSAGEQKQGGAA